MAQPPDQAIDRNDRGDDIFRRYRYQATYAGILALRLLPNDSDLIELFAEHHDDILLKFRSGRFHAVQVKTQQPGGLPFKSSDEEIQTALKKFISHERTFGDLFERYTIVTNHHFFRADNKSSLYFLSDHAKKATGDQPGDMDSRLSGFINSLVTSYNRGKPPADRVARGHVLSVLQKLCVDDGLPKLEGIHATLRDAIVLADADYRAATYADLDRAAHALAHDGCLKSSLSSDGVAHLYLSLSRNPAGAADTATIDGKRITKDVVVELIGREISAAALLAAADPIDPQAIPADLTTADKKMTAGGLSATTVAAARDWQASAEFLQRQWAMKYDEGPAIERYNHVAVAVQTACAEAHEETREDGPHGPAMLSKLKEVLQRKRAEGTEFYDCDEEHLLGHAVIRTGQCKVWWSPEFDVT